MILVERFALPLELKRIQGEDADTARIVARARRHKHWRLGAELATGKSGSL